MTFCLLRLYTRGNVGCRGRWNDCKKPLEKWLAESESLTKFIYLNIFSVQMDTKMLVMMLSSIVVILPVSDHVFGPLVALTQPLITTHTHYRPHIHLESHIEYSITTNRKLSDTNFRIGVNQALGLTSC